MSYQFQKHYTREDANALLGQIREWLTKLKEVRTELESVDRKMLGLVEPGRDIGGALVNRWIHLLADLRTFLNEFLRREIQVKDLDRGLIDFPAIVGGREVFLCWEMGEEEVEFWHDLDTGYAGREKL